MCLLWVCHSRLCCFLCRLVLAHKRAAAPSSREWTSFKAVARKLPTRHAQLTPFSKPPTSTSPKILSTAAFGRCATQVDLPWAINKHQFRVKMRRRASVWIRDGKPALLWMCHSRLCFSSCRLVQILLNVRIVFLPCLFHRGAFHECMFAIRGQVTFSWNEDALFAVSSR